MCVRTTRSEITLARFDTAIIGIFTIPARYAMFQGPRERLRSSVRPSAAPPIEEHVPADHVT
jgi:hypothetical protein